MSNEHDKFKESVKLAEESLAKRRPSKGAVRDRTVRLTGELSLDDAQQIIKQRVDLAVSDLRKNIEKVAARILEEKREVLVVVETPNEGILEIEGLTHFQFPTLLHAAHIRDRHGHRKNIFLKGAKGGGKSTACKQVADALGLDFGYIGQVNMPHLVVGSQDPIDKDHFRHTAFTKIFRDGGVIVFEELDGWHPNASLVLNAPLANGYLVLDNGELIHRHPDCVVIACANTWGSGATTEYVGRNKLDDAFLDRFAVKLEWEYDKVLERKFADNDEVTNAVQKARFNAGHYGIKIGISPRSTFDIADMVRAGFTLYDAMKYNFLSSVDKKTERKLLEDVDY